MSEFVWYGPIDVHDDQWWRLADTERRIMADLLETLGLDVHLTWRLEYLADAGEQPMVRAFQYVRGAAGHILMGLFGDIETRTAQVPIYDLPRWWQP